MTRLSLPTVAIVGNYDVPMVGAVVVSFQTLRFGLSNETLMLLTSVHTPEGRSVSPIEHERVAQYLESIGVL